MKKIILYTIITSFLLSCNSDDSIIEESGCKLQNIDVTFLEPTLGDDTEPVRWTPPTLEGSFPNVSFEYDNFGKIEKSHGGFITIPESTGHHRYFSSDKIYDSIVHNSNTIEIFKRHSLSNLLPFKDIDISYELNTIGDPIKKTTPLYTFSYTYKNGKLIESTRFRFVKDVSLYSYDNDNLVKIETILLDSNENPYYRVIDTFEEYDDKENPFRGLFYIRGTFYRSLSKNNYRVHNKAYYQYLNGEWRQTGYGSNGPNFDYDENDLPKFGEYNCN